MSCGGSSEVDVSMGKRIEVFANVPGGVHRYVIVPFGVYFHRQIREAKRGDEVWFNEGWRVVKMRYAWGCVVRVNSPVFMFFVRSLYGEGVTIGGLMRQWEAVSVNEGYGKRGFSRDEVMIVEVEEIKND